jgi:2-oxoglutarate/2-oxoacid ferredoxin oxidoreductase subunit alpha
MQQNKKHTRSLIDASRLIIESLARAGADTFIGYPITPANLLYHYGSQRMPLMLSAPDEITTLQWMAGLSATGKIPVTATSFPGYALMIESINMAYMMELPMVIILVQRLGPATGTATCGAQGDLNVLRGTISGGHPFPVLCTSSFEDCWKLPALAVKTAINLRTPVVLLTSKEEVMTQKSYDINSLPIIEKAERKYYDLECDSPYKSYKPTDMVPDFLPVTQEKQQIRLNASTHDRWGILQHSNDEAMDNTRRLEEKIRMRSTEYTEFEYNEVKNARNLVVAFGITASAARDAVNELSAKGEKVSLLVPKTLFPAPEKYLEIMEQYDKVVLAEENINNQFADMLYGMKKPDNLHFIGSLGKMITPQQIIKEVLA